MGSKSKIGYEISGAQNREGTESSLTNQRHINGVQIKKRKVTAYPPCIETLHFCWMQRIAL